MNHLPLDKSITLDSELKKAGVEMVTEQVWELDNFEGYWTKKEYKLTTSSQLLPAATLSELEAMLPDVIVIGELEYELQIFRSNGISVVVYIDLDNDESIVYVSGETLLEAVYKALLWCLREGYIIGKK